jgi:hypothetical protein
MSQEELLLEQWRYLPTQEQIAVINFAEFLRHKNRAEVQEDLDYGRPEHLKVRSIEHLNELLQEGLDSGDPIEVTDEWWNDRRQALLEGIQNKA